MKNVIIAQSGGPSSVINNTLRGIIETCKYFPDKFGTIYGGWHGIEGVLKEELLNLSEQPEQEISLLRTPLQPVVSALAVISSKTNSKRISSVFWKFSGHTISDTSFISAEMIHSTPLSRSARWPGSGVST